MQDHNIFHKKSIYKELLHAMITNKLSTLNLGSDLLTLKMIASHQHVLSVRAIRYSYKDKHRMSNAQ